MGNKLSFGSRIPRRSYNYGFTGTDPCKGDIVSYRGTPYLVDGACGTHSFRVVELPTKDEKYVCPSSEPIWGGVDNALIGSPGGYGICGETLTWKGLDYRNVTPILRCSQKMNWEQYIEWFGKYRLM